MELRRYYFHIVENGALVLDDEGMILSRLAARAELRTSVQDLAGARMRAGYGPGNGCVELTDTYGNVLETLLFRKTLQ